MMRGDATEAWLQAAAGLLTLGLLVSALVNPISRPAALTEAPKPTQVTLSVVEEPPPPRPQAAPPPEPEPPPPPAQPAPSPPPAQPAPSPLPAQPVPSPLAPQSASSPLPPPPPRPRHVARPRHPPPPHPVPQEAAPQPMQRPAAPAAAPAPARAAQQAPENHSAEAAYIGRLHALVARNTVPPSGTAYRLAHPSGEVEVGFTLSRNGAVSDVHVIRSSGSALLDHQGIAVVAGQHYPAMPDDAFAGAPVHAFSVPVNFPYAGAAEGL